LEEKMDEFNKLETAPTVEAIVKEEPIIEVKPVEPVIEEAPAPAPVEAPKPAPAAKPAKEDKNLVGLYSSKDFTGISKGYSKVDKSLATELLKNKNIRLATEEEVKAHLNK
jgi:hypothetical protein